MWIKLKRPVGDLSGLPRRKDDGNVPAEVKEIKVVLSRLGIAPQLMPDGKVDPELIDVITRFQKLFMRRPDGRIDPSGGTLRRLNQLANRKAIIVDLRRQILTAYASARRAYRFDCTSGTAADPTPPGYYAIQRKYAKYRSKTYDAQMDYAMFFYRGYAIHMAVGVEFTSMLKRAGFGGVGSHGCVRLSEENARILFGWAPLGTPVVILPKV